MSEFGVERIAVLRATALGDFVFCVPALLALRAAYPRAEICLLGRPWHASFLRDRPGPVDRVIVVPPSRGVREEPGAAEDPRELDAFFARMRAERFDVALQMHGGGRWSNPFATRLGARLTVGCRAGDAPALDRWIAYVYRQPEIARWIEVAGLAGAAPVTLEPVVAVVAADLEEAAPFTGAGPFAVVVSNDTGPLHLAVAVGAPTVGIFWIGNLVNSGPLGRARRSVRSWRRRWSWPTARRRR